MKKKLLYEGANCPICESSKLKLSKKGFKFDYKNVHTTIRKEVLMCDICKESFIQPHEEREFDKMLTDERRRIDGLLTTGEIKAIRKKFGMNQVDFSKFLRLSEKAFARYESGQSNQSMAIDNLLRVLKAYPNTIEIFNTIPRKMAS